MVMSDALKSTYRGVSDGTLQVIDLFFEVFPEDSLRVYLDGEEQTTGFTFDRNTTPQRVTFDAPIPEGVNVIIRRNSDLSELPHVFHYTGNIKGGAEFNSRNMDENFAKILRASEDAMDSFELVGLNVEAAADADAAAQRARDAADDAEASYQNTLAYDLQAKQYRDAAKQYSEDSEASAVVASGHAQDANTARVGAEAAKAAAEQARDTAQTHRDDALGFRDEAEQFKNSADSSRQAAAGSANAAQLAEQGADTSATAAAGSASSAAQSASAANTSRQQAQSAASSANNARDLAYAWANNPEDQAVENNEFSAYHWAKKAETSADGPVHTEDSLSIEFAGDGTLTNPLSAEVTGLGTAAERDVGTSSGNVMEVGAFGLGSPIELTSSDDIDTLTRKTGFYRWGATPPANAPTNYGAMLSMHWGGGFTQLFSGSNQELYYRRLPSNSSTVVHGGIIHHTGNILKTTGNNGNFPMSQKAVTDALDSITVSWSDVSGKPSSFAPSSHNHSAANITSGTLPGARMPMGAGGVGTYAFVGGGSGASASWGGTIAGSSLRPASISGISTSGLSGTWRIMGNAVGSGAGSTVAVRIS